MTTSGAFTGADVGGAGVLRGAVTGGLDATIGALTGSGCFLTSAG